MEEERSVEKVCKKEKETDESTNMRMKVLSIFLEGKWGPLSQPEDDFGQLSVISEWVFGQGQSGFCSARIPAQMNDPFLAPTSWFFI